MICHAGDIVSTSSGEGAVVKTLSSDFAVAPICVFWITDDCRIPVPLDFFKVSRNIKKSLWNCNHRGQVDVRAYGRHKTLGVPPYVGGELVFKDGDGVFSPFPPGEASEEPMLKKLFVDVLAWALHNPSPAHILFIARDMTLHNYGLLFKLKLMGYNILLGTLPKPDPRISDHQFSRITSTLWHWNRLSHGRFPVTLSLPILPGSEEAHLEGDDVTLKERLEELEQLEKMDNASASCKEFLDSVDSKPDPLLPEASECNMGSMWTRHSLIFIAS